MPEIQQAAILTVDILQVGSSTPGSIAHLQIVGLILPAPRRDLARTKIPHTNIRPVVDKFRRDSGKGMADFSRSVSRINDVLDIVVKANDELADRIRVLERSPEVGRYNANIVTPDPLAVSSDLVPWAQVTVRDGEVWHPIAGWATAKTAPIGDDLIFDVLFAEEFSAVDTPVWQSMFLTGNDNKLVLPDGENRLVMPVTTFD
jgi:hypothetical protein